MAEATMEGLAFPSPHSRGAGSEEAGRTLLEGNPCLGFPSNSRSAPCHPSKEHEPMYRLTGSGLTVKSMGGSEF